MKFKKIVLDNFLVFSHVEFTFNDGLNIIHGNNEKGKSSIVKGIISIIFGITKSEKEFFKNRNSKTGDRFAGMIEIENNGETVYIERDFDTDKTIVTENRNILFNGVISKGARATEKNNYLNIISKYFFVSDLSLFKHLFCIEQGELDRNFEKDDLISLKDLIPRASEHKYSEVLQEIIEDYYKLTRAAPAFMPKGRGMSKDRDIEIHSSRIKSLESELSEANVLKNEMIKLNEELKSLNNEQMSMDETIYNAEQEIIKQEALLKKANELEYKSKEKKLYQTKLMQLDQLEEQLKQVQDQMMEEDARLSGSILPESIMFFLVTVLSISLSIIFPSLLYVWASLIALILIIFVFYTISKYKEKRSKEQISSRLLLEQSRVEEALATLPIRTKLIELIETLESLENEKILSLDVEDEIIKLKAKQKEQKSREQYVAKRIAEISGRLGSIKFDKSAYQIEEEISDLKKTLEEKEFKKNVLETSAKYLDQAINNYVSNYLERISLFIDDKLPILTGNSYKKICIGDSMNFQLQSQQCGDFTSPFLSFGIKDMSWYLLRLAIIKGIIGNEHYFLFLDDPFVHIDNERRKRIFELLAKDENIDQVILFSHDEWYLRTCGDFFDNINIIKL